MTVDRRIGLVAVVSLASLLGISTTARAQANTPEEKTRTADRTKAITLYREHKSLEALPIFERLYKNDPADRGVKESLAGCLITQSATLPDAEAIKVRIRARELLVELIASGPAQDLSKVYLDMMTPDGKMPAFSSRKDVEAAMREGEAAFSRREYAKARMSYLRAFALDPKQQTAALFVGDTYFAEEKLDDANAWFERASIINPDYAAAYRYWGDSLTKQGKQAEARSKFFLGIVALPYARPPWASLRQWARENDVVVTHPTVLPEDLAPDGIRIAQVEDGTIHVGLYAKRRDAWEKTTFKERFPAAPAYRHTLVEEADALGSVIDAVEKDIAAGKVKTLNKNLALLLKIHNEGLLEAYILLGRADEGISSDYPAYRANHQDKLLTYLGRYVAPMKEVAK